MDEDAGPPLPKVLAPTDEAGLKETEAYRVEAAQKLRAAIAEHARQLKEREATIVDLESLTATAWFEIPVSLGDLAHALLLTDLTTVRRKGWSTATRLTEARKPGSSLDAYEVLTDVIALDAEASIDGTVKAGKSAGADRIATVLELRGQSLRVTAGDNALRCWVDIPLHLGPGDLAIRSAPFRVASTNLYRLIANTGQGASLSSGVLRMRYNPTEGTLLVPYPEGPIPLATQRLKRRSAEPEGTAATAGTAPLAQEFDADVLVAALAYASLSVEAAGKAASTPYVEIRQGRAVAVSHHGISILQHSGLDGLELFIEQAHVVTLLGILGRIKGAATVVTDERHYHFRDDCFHVSVARLDREPISGVGPLLRKIDSQSGPRLEVTYEELLLAISRLAYRANTQKPSRLTQIKVGKLQAPPSDPGEAAAMNGGREETCLTGADQRVHLHFLTPFGPPGPGWAIQQIPILGSVDLADAPDWLTAGQIFDVRQFAKVFFAHPQAHHVALRIVERALVLNQPVEGGSGFSVLPRQTGIEFSGGRPVPAA